MKAARWTIALAALLAAAGAWSQNCTLRDPNLRGSYDGDCARGWANGQGRAAGRDRYEGAFMDGHAHGQGVYTFADGTRFEGLFVNGRVNGRASFHYPNGDVLDGEFRDNRLTGTGSMRRASGETTLVQLQGGTMVALVPPPAPAPPPVPPPGAAVPAAPDGAVAPAAASVWSPRLDFADLFPSFILATATRKSESGAAASRSVQAPRGDALGAIDAAAFVSGRPADGVQSRYLGSQANVRYVGDEWGLVGIRYTNATPGARVTLRVAIDEIAEPTEASFTLPDAGDYLLYPKLRYRYDKLLAISQPRPVNVSWQVDVDGRSLGAQSGVVRIRALQDAPIALRTERGPERLLWVFAGFVTEDAPWIDEVIRDAFAGAPEGALGYQTDADGVDRQVAALYQLLRRRGVKYSDITATSGASDQVFSQVVRFPVDAMRTSQANCVDGTVLMASVLRKMGIEPIIVTGPGHALLGYFRKRPRSGDKPDLQFVETTMIGSADFPAALAAGQRQVAAWADKESRNPAFQLIPVFMAREQGVMPIPR